MSLFFMVQVLEPRVAIGNTTEFSSLNFVFLVMAESFQLNFVIADELLKLYVFSHLDMTRLA